MRQNADCHKLSIVIPALHEGQNLILLLPQLRRLLDQMMIESEILVVTQADDTQTISAVGNAASVILQTERGYGGALIAGFNAATGTHVITMDADLSHPPEFICDMWSARTSGDVIVASRYVQGGRAQMPAGRFILSRVLNMFFSRGLSLPIRDMSSGFRLYKAAVVQNHSFTARDFDILQEILVWTYSQGWQVCEVPFDYAPRQYGSSHARVIQFGVAYLRTFAALWKLRNSILAADYDDRAHDSPIPLQRYWQRQRFAHIQAMIAGEGRVLDVGCGSSRIISILPAGSLALDILLRKVRYARKFHTLLIQGSGFQLPVADGSFPCVLCSQVIEHVPKESPILGELSRALATGGRLVLGTPDYANWEWVMTEKLYGFFAPGAYADEHISHYTKQELIERFERHGFKFEEARYILRGELILAFRKK